MEVRHLVPRLSLELPALAVKALHLFLLLSARRHRRAQHPWGCGVTEKYPVNWVGRISFFSTDHFKALVTKAQTRTGGTFPLSLLGENFRRLQEQIWGR